MVIGALMLSMSGLRVQTQIDATRVVVALIDNTAGLLNPNIGWMDCMYTHIMNTRPGGKLHSAATRTWLIAMVCLILLLSVPFFLLAETGMCLITTGGGFWGTANVVRIDVVDNVIKTPSNSLGYGTAARFSPDGQQICFFKNGGNTIAIATINGQELRTFSCIGFGGSPGGWAKLTWTTANAIWVGADAQIVKYDTLGAKLMTYALGANEYRGMVSRAENTAASTYINGVYKPVLYQLNGANFTTIWPNISGDGCSLCPSPNGLLITNNLLNSPTGNGTHRTMRILNRDGSLNRYLNIQDITPFSASDYHIDGQCWSGNSNDWIVIPAGQGSSDVQNNCSPCVYNITTAQKFCFKDNTNTGSFWNPWDYFSGWAPNSTTPVLQLSPTALSFTADSGSSNPTAQNVIASTASGTLSGLSVSGAKSWITVTPSTTSGSSITIANAMKISGLTPGVYLDTITVTTTNGAGSKTYAVTLTINRPSVVQVLSSVTVSPIEYTVAAGASISYLAACNDQSNAYLAGATRSWSVSGGGTIDAVGKFIAGATATHGPHLVICAASFNGKTVRDTARVMISRPKNASLHKRIDCGTNSFCPAGWETDDAYRTGANGTDYDNASSPVTAGIAGVAPMEVYKSVRQGSPHSYLVSGLTAGPYTVRLHFIDWKDTARTMSYTILGANVLRDFRISTLAGGANRALALDFPALAQDTSGIPIVCQAASGNVFEAGFEVMQNYLKSITLLSPLGGQKYSAGQTIQIQFRTDTMAISQVYLKLSVDNGRSYHNLTGNYGISRSASGAAWGTYSWKIPNSIVTDNGTMLSTVSSICRIRIEPYQAGLNDFDFSDSAFTISAALAIASSPGAPNAAEGLVITAAEKRMMMALSAAAFRIDIFALSGKRLCSFSGMGRQTFTLPASMSEGVVIVKMTTAAGRSWAVPIAGHAR